MQKVDGVQTVRVSLKEGLTVLELRPDNTVTLSQLRTVIKNNGFVSKDAQILARGTPRDGIFEVGGTGERLTVSAPPTAVDGRWQLTAIVK
jgi:hypothetical protein